MQDLKAAFNRYPVKAIQAGLSSTTVRIYGRWILLYIQTYSELSDASVDAFIKQFKAGGRYSTNTIRQGYHALRSFAKIALNNPLNDVFPPNYSKNKKAFTGISIQNIGHIIFLLKGDNRLIAQLIYGSGLRLSEVLSLCVHNIRLKTQTIILGENRRTFFSEKIKPDLSAKMIAAKIIYSDDQKYDIAPMHTNGDAIRSGQASLFPSHLVAMRNDGLYRPVLDPSGFQRALRKTGKRFGIKISPKLLRRAALASFFEQQCEFDEICRIMGYKSLDTVTTLHRLWVKQSRPKSVLPVSPMDYYEEHFKIHEEGNLNEPTKRIYN